MKITSADIKYLRKNGFYSVNNENVTHKKVLPYLSVVQSLEGSYDITLGNGIKQKTVEGGFFIAPSNVSQTITHHVNRESGKMSARWIFLDIEINRSAPLDALFVFPTVINDERRQDLNDIFDRIFSTDNIWRNYSDCYALAEYLVSMSAPASDKINNVIRDTVLYMKENCKREIGVKEISDFANMSESNLYAVFKKNMGTSPMAYLNHYRLSLAAERLTESDSTVSEISCSVGIGDALYFSKLFKKTYGMSPKEYRLLYRGKK